MNAVKSFKSRIPTAPSARRLTLVSALLLAAVLGGLALFVLSRPQQVELPYSVFIEQVRARNVQQITLRNDQITGTFREAVSWPIGTPASAADYLQFVTTIAPDVTNSRLFALLEQEDVTITVAQPTPPWYMFVLLWGGPLLVLLGILWAIRRSRRLARRSLRRPQRIDATIEEPDEMSPVPILSSQPEWVTSLALPSGYQILQPEERLEDIVGHDEAKRDLKDLIASIRSEADSPPGLSHHPRGILLVGLPGTGRTLLARAVAGESGSHFLKVDVPELLEIHRKENNLLHRLFEAAQRIAPIILLLDKIDILETALPDHDNSVGRRDNRQWFLRDLISEMGNLPPQSSVVVFAAASHLRHINPIFLRPGRFERQISLSLPIWSERLELLSRQMRNVSLAEDVDLKAIAHQTVGLSGADLVTLCHRASWLSGRDGRDAVTQNDLLEALTQIALAGETSGWLLDAQKQRIAAFHEAGHALLNQLLSKTPHPESLSILPGSDWSPPNDYASTAHHQLVTRAALLARLTVILAGRSAEEIALGDISTASENDLEQASRLARRMAARWGMSDLGPVSFPLLDNLAAHSPELVDSYQYSESSAAQIDRAVRVLLEDRHAVARHVLKANRSLLDHLANLLLREETIRGESLVRLMEKISSVASLEEPRAKR